MRASVQLVLCGIHGLTTYCFSLFLYFVNVHAHVHEHAHVHTYVVLLVWHRVRLVSRLFSFSTTSTHAAVVLLRPSVSLWEAGELRGLGRPTESF